MSTKERAPLGFGDQLDDLSSAAFAKPKRAANDKPKPEEARKAAEAAGFRSREPVKAPAEQEEPAVPPRRRRTGRNAQINIKTKAETIEAFTRIADANGWGLGETFERATELLKQKHLAK